MGRHAATTAVVLVGAMLHAPVNAQIANRDLEGVPPFAWKTVPELGKRDFPMLAYDEHRKRLVLFGGWLAWEEDTGDTWEWDGKDWRYREVARAPRPRRGGMLVYDPVRKTIVLFGGTWDRERYDNFLDDMWEWDGIEWRPIDVPTPPARAFAAIGFDPIRKRVVLFGGFNKLHDTTGLLADTWEWDGVRWTRSVSHPVARGEAAIAYCRNTQRMVLYDTTLGGVDTWEWDGQSWTRRAVPGPGGGYWRMAADPLSGGVLLCAATTWLWSGSAWSLVDSNTPGGVNAIAGSWSSGEVWRPVLGDAVPGLATMAWDGTAWRKVWEREWSGRPLPQYDVRRDQIVLIPHWLGGDTYVLEGDRFRSFPNSPLPATGGWPVYHGTLGCVVVREQVAPFDLWKWDGQRWSVIPASGPRPGVCSSASAMAYDISRNKLVMLCDANVDEQWEWDQSGWTKITPVPNHAATGTVRLGYDAEQQRLLLVGERRKGSGLEIWEWNGAGWIEVRSSPNPPMPDGAGPLVYAPALGGFVLWGWPKPLLLSAQKWHELEQPINRAFAATYNVADRRLVAFNYLWYPGNDMAWLERTLLRARRDYVRPGGTIELDVKIPEAGHDWFILALARGTYPGIPLRTVGGLGTENLPLTADDLLAVTLQAGLRTRLAGLGAGGFSLPVPNDQSLLDQRFFAAGFVLRANGTFGAISNAVSLEIGR